MPGSEAWADLIFPFHEQFRMQFVLQLLQSLLSFASAAKIMNKFMSVFFQKSCSFIRFSKIFDKNRMWKCYTPHPSLLFRRDQRATLFQA